jgi:hypothetical protein
MPGIQSKTRPYLEKLQDLEQQRQEWAVTWKDIRDYILPRRGAFFNEGQRPNQGEKRGSKIIDGTATRCLRKLAAGMQGGLTSKSRPWFRLIIPDSDLMEFAPVRRWLDEVERRMYRVLAIGNFYAATHTMYQEAAGFASAVLWADEDIRDVVRFRVLSAGEFCISEGHHGRIDTLYRRFPMTARNLAKKFGKNKLTRAVQDQLDKAPYERHQVIHCCHPRKKGEGMAFDSKHFQPEGDFFMSEKGYEEQPFMVARWDAVGGDDYGRGPCHDVLSDVMMLQEMQKTFIRAMHKEVDPPLQTPPLNKMLDLRPNGVTEVQLSKDSFIRRLYDSRPDLKAAYQQILDVRAAIKEALYVDLFITTADPRPGERTAYEVAKRHEEKLMMLGPTVERMQSDVFNPALDRTFYIMARQNLIPAPPEELRDTDLQIDYISILAQAQKMVTIESIRGVVEHVTAASAVQPDVVDKLDLDQSVDEIAEAYGAPAKIVRSDEEVAQMRQQRAQQQQAQMQQQQAMEQAAMAGEMAQAGKTLAETPMGDSTALEALNETLGGVQ